MIGCTQNFLNDVSSCTYDDVAGCMRDASGAPKYPYTTATRVSGWSYQWALGSSGLSCSHDTFNKLNSSAEVTAPAYEYGCFKAVSGAKYQLKVVAGAALDGNPPPPPPPP